MTKPIPEDFIPIQFNSATEFQERERYLPQLTCEKDQLDRIVGKYSFTEKEQLECGLNGCKTKHWHGWVIRTKNGDETHCGKNCGESAFGVLFKEVEAIYKAAVERQSKREHIEKLLQDRDALLAEARPLYARVSEAINHIQLICNEIKRDAPLDRAFHDCLRSDGRIRVEDEDSKRINAAMGADSSRANIKVIGTIRGSSVVFSEGRVATELKYKVLLPLDELTPENLNALTDKELTAKTQSLSQIQQTLSSAKHFLAECNHFRSPANADAFNLLQLSMPKKARTNRVTRILERIGQMYRDAA